MSSRQALGPTEPPIQWVSGAIFPGIKRSGLEADHSPPNNAEVKKTWIYTSTPNASVDYWSEFLVTGSIPGVTRFSEK
jgi:hypothetical protein